MAELMKACDALVSRGWRTSWPLQVDLPSSDAALTVFESSSYDGNKDTRSLVMLQTLREQASSRASNVKGFECSINRRTYRNGVVVDTLDSSSRKENARKKFRIWTGGA